MKAAVLPADFLIPRKWIFACCALIVGISALVAMKSNTNYYWVLALWILLFGFIFLFLLRPKPLEILFFLLPLVVPAIPALTHIEPILITVFWLVILLIIYYVRNCTEGWDFSGAPTPYVLPLVIYAVILIFSIYAASVESVSVSSLSQCVALIAIYWILSKTLRRENINHLIVAIIFGTVLGSIIFLIAYMQESWYTALSGLIFGVFRPVVLKYNANSWATYSAIGIPFLAALAIYTPVKNLRWLWMAPVGVLLTIVAVLNMSRGALVAIFAGISFIFLTHSRGRRLFTIGLLMLLIAIFIIFPSLESLLETALRLESGLSGRGQLWAIAWKIIEENPLFGLGPGSYHNRFFFNATFIDNGLMNLKYMPTTHNVLLQIGTDLGLTGPLIILFLYGMFFLRSRKIWFQLKNRPEFPALVAVTASMIAGFTRGLFEVNFSVPHAPLTVNLILITLLSFQDQIAFRSNGDL